MISRELRRNTGTSGIFHAPTAQGQMRQRREACRPQKKLVLVSELLELVGELLRKKLSRANCRQAAQYGYPQFEDVYVCRDMICSAVNL